MDRKRKIILITGSYPPNFCGVADYTQKLYKILSNHRKNEIEVFVKSNWKIKNIFLYTKELISRKVDIYHMQYPTEGYGYSMVPLVLIIFLRLARKKVIVTIHELSSRNILAYIYTQLLVFFAVKVIVTNRLELKHACRYIFKSRKVTLIPIASNIKQSEFSDNKFDRRYVDVAYFGHIRPIKGIEDFLNTISLLNRNLKSQLIGQVPKNYEDFFAEIKQKSKMLKVEVINDRSEDEVADLLSDIKIAYLPFPDGISNRRGTALASLLNGCVVISRRSEIDEFNHFFDKYVYLVDSNEEAVHVINKLLSGQFKPKNLIHFKDIFSWENVLSEHLKIYNC